MALSNIFNTARSALRAQQLAMNVTARNIANASTPGYTRQRLMLRTLGGGGGVETAGIERVRDRFLDASYRRETSFLGASSTDRFFLQQVEGAFGEPSDLGVGASLDRLFQSFGDLAADPNSPVAKEEVKRSGAELARRMRHLDASIRSAMEQAAKRMEDQVSRANEISRQVAELNGRIREAGNGADPGLLDLRDSLVDELAGLLPVETSVESDGSMTVASGGVALVSGTDFRSLEVKPREGGGFGVGLQGSDSLLDPGGGSIQALSDLGAKTLPDFLSRLDSLAEAVVREVNTLHRGGSSPEGETGIRFFDAAGTTAGTISLSSEVSASADAIVAGDGAGDNSVALDLAALGEKTIDSLGGRTFQDHYAALGAAVGGAVRGAAENEEAAQTLRDRAGNLRDGVGGVSIDEEMVNLIGQQEAYSAAARLVGVADQMVQEILFLTR